MALFLGFRYFKLQNKFQIVQEFHYTVVSSLKDSGVGLVISMVCFSPIIQR